ncbi:MAG: hypothetical protein WDO16_21155 [Bacteroidota bacterium]
MLSLPALTNCARIFLSLAFAMSMSEGNTRDTHTGKREPGDSLIDKLRPDFDNDPVVTSDSAGCTIPFNKAGNLIIIQARVDTMVGNFILDTGAPGLILNMTYFRNYPSSSHGDDESGGITGGVLASSPTPCSQPGTRAYPLFPYRCRQDRPGSY